MRPLPNSGTAARQSFREALSIPGAVVGGAMGGGNPLAAAAGAMAPMLAKGLSAKLLMSGPVQKIIGNQAAAGPLRAYNAGQSNPVVRALLGLIGSGG
jgi:hypothetical protein